MPVHDWTRVSPDIFHAFHTAWITHLSETMNGGLLPSSCYALPELDSPSSRQRTLTIRQVTGHRVIALLEIVSPANKDRARHVEDFVTKMVGALAVGVHLLVIDLFRAGLHDPQGIHGGIFQQLDEDAEVLFLCRTLP